MEPLVRTLTELLTTERETTLSDAKWLKKTLRNRHAEDSRIYVLSVAVAEDLPRQLLAGGSPEVLMCRFAAARSIEAPMARWAACAWRQALLQSGILMT